MDRTGQDLENSFLWSIHQAMMKRLREDPNWKPEETEGPWGFSEFSHPQPPPPSFLMEVWNRGDCHRFSTSG